MEETKDSYKTISKASEEAIFKDRNSKFFGYAFPVKDEDEVKIHLESLKKSHYTARHWCYAYQLGTEKIRYRANDDGEPNNSAGMPIYGQIQSFEVTNVLVVVVRYFGGTKLGVGGLINAYRKTAQLALESSKIIEKTIDTYFQIQLDYKHMSRIMRLIKEHNADIISQKLEINCRINVAIRKSGAELFYDSVNKIHEVIIEII